jgi:hypothetical protein
MAVRRKQVKKPVEHVGPEDKAKVVKQLQLVAQEAKKLEADIHELGQLLDKSYFRLL